MGVKVLSHLGHLRLSQKGFGLVWFLDDVFALGKPSGMEGSDLGKLSEMEGSDLGKPSGMEG